MTQSSGPNGYREILTDDESLALFLRSMAEFDRRFCDAMTDGGEFTLKIEVHGNKGELIHASTSGIVFRRPRGVEARVEKKKRTEKSL